MRAGGAGGGGWRAGADVAWVHPRAAVTSQLAQLTGCWCAHVCWSRDVFWESTGLHGQSTVREVDLESGAVLRSRSLPHVRPAGGQPQRAPWLRYLLVARACWRVAPCTPHVWALAPGSSFIPQRLLYASPLRPLLASRTLVRA